MKREEQTPSAVEFLWMILANIEDEDEGEKPQDQKKEPTVKQINYVDSLK